MKKDTVKVFIGVSILVLMDSFFLQETGKSICRGVRRVSILVLMDSFFLRGEEGRYYEETGKRSQSLF